MKAATFGAMITLLSMMPDPGMSWPDQKDHVKGCPPECSACQKVKVYTSMYDAVVHNWSDELASAVLDYVKLRCEWRPRPAKLMEIAMSITCALPDVSLVVREITDKIEKYGVYTEHVPGFKSLRIESKGPPRFSNPFVDDVVSRMSISYLQMCEGKVYERDIRNSIEEAYKTCRKEWDDRIAADLSKPESKRSGIVQKYDLYKLEEYKPVKKQVETVKLSQVKQIEAKKITKIAKEIAKDLSIED